MNITLLNTSISTGTDKNGKPYQIADVAFKNNTYGGKVEGKKITSYNKAAFDVLAVAMPGDIYEITTEKKGQYVEWTAMVKATAGSPAPAPQAFAGRTTATNPSPRSNYETPEERAQRQVFIVRQSSIANAVSALSVGAKSALKAGEVVALAKEFESYVFAQPKLGGETGFDDVPDLDPTFDTNQPNIE